MQLFNRATRVIPGGIYGHTSPAASIAGETPYYADRAAGCRYWDVDGNEYIDYMCGYGPMVVGHNHPEVEEAAECQRRAGDCMNHPTERMVELIEKLVGWVDFASWGVLAKNGSDVTTWSIQVARESTRRSKVLKISGAYHGVDAWCTPGHAGLIPEDREHVHEFRWNDLEGFHQLVSRFSDEIAAVIVTPFHHPLFNDAVMPSPDFFPEIERVCRDRGIILILDDIRAGFRLHLGGSHRVFGFTPDIICFCKAMGNGYPISAALGAEPLRIPASKVFLTGSYWSGAVAMAAALKTLEILEREDGIEKMERMGRLLMDGLIEQGKKNGFEVVASGPPAVPFMTIRGDNLKIQQRFCSEMMRLGSFLHPHHNWFLSLMHQPADIQRTVEHAGIAFREVRLQIGAGNS